MLRRVLGAFIIAVAIAPRSMAQNIQASATGCEQAAAPDTAASRADSTPTRQRDSSATARAAAEPPSGKPTVVLYASASAREVRFAAQPRIVVRLCGAVTDSVHVLERRNLPERVQPGVTYRDVFIAVEIIGHLNADCLAQRIGVSDRPASADCASLNVRDSTGAAARRPPP